MVNIYYLPNKHLNHFPKAVFSQIVPSISFFFSAPYHGSLLSLIAPFLVARVASAWTL